MPKVSFKWVGGLMFWRIGRLGGSLYIASLNRVHMARRIADLKQYANKNQVSRFVVARLTALAIGFLLSGIAY